MAATLNELDNAKLEEAVSRFRPVQLCGSGLTVSEIIINDRRDERF